MNQIDFEGLGKALLADALRLCTQWLPGGHLRGNEYCCSDIRGGPGDSMKVNIKTGMWRDFGTSDPGGSDLISLFAAVENLTQIEAARQLAAKIGFGPVAQASEPVFGYHSKLGKPTAMWAYHDATGATILFYTARYDTPSGKQFLPWSRDGQGKWVCKGYPVPRPLYNLPEFKAHPKRPVLIVEGEKAADAARKLCGHAYVVTTWANGAQAVKRSDWGPCYKRDILIWPDADAPGNQAALDIAKELERECVEIYIINTNGLPEGYDAADYIADHNIDYNEFLTWSRARVSLFNSVSRETVLSSTETLSTPTDTVVPSSETVVVHQDDDIPQEMRFTVHLSDDPAPSGSMAAIVARYGLTTTTTGVPIPNEDNVIRVFEADGHLRRRIWFDDFYQTIFLKTADGSRKWQDIDTYKLTILLQRQYFLSRISEATVRRCVCVIAQHDHRNEPRDWMESLSWDKTPRIRRFFVDYMGARDNNYTECVGKNFWVSLVARTYNPGCIMRTMVVLKSKQWAGKSTAFAIIGGKYYCEALESLHSNNFLQALRGKILIEFADLSGFDRSDINRIKQIISCRTDCFRAPYDREPMDHPRRCVLVGTTNEDTFLRDDTGGTRFWPIETGTILHSKLEEDRDQLFAEAIYLFKNKENWHIMPTKITEEIQEEYRQKDEWEQVINEYVQSKRVQHITISDLARDCLHIGVDKLDKSVQMRLARNLKVIGWQRKRVRSEHNLLWVWCPPDSQISQLSTAYTQEEW